MRRIFSQDASSMRKGLDAGSKTMKAGLINGLSTKYGNSEAHLTSKNKLFFQNAGLKSSENEQNPSNKQTDEFLFGKFSKTTNLSDLKSKNVAKKPREFNFGY